MISIDIFCDVIDNFGDAGVCWRLANICANEKDANVNLYINDVETLSKITGGSPIRPPQKVDNIFVRNWNEALERPPSEVVIETFGCRLPESFEKRMAAMRPTPVWINLEYLSAEDWVEGCHCLPSPHPSLNIEKTFFFPGVTDKTGGVMLEKDYAEEKQKFLLQKTAFLRSFDFDPSVFTVFVFCYPSPVLKDFYAALLKDGRSINLLVPRSAAAEILLTEHKQQNCPFINLRVAEMVKQSAFDQFLWASDALIVRGEDSFVRAQLSGKPFIWNIYPQTEETHIKKLKAFAERIKPYYGRFFDLWLKANLAWNMNGEELGEAWPKWRDSQSKMRSCAQHWLDHLVSIGSLGENLWAYIQKKLIPGPQR